MLLVLAISAILAVILAGCVTERQRQRICNDCAHKDSTSFRSDTSRHETVRVDTAWQLIEVPIAGPVQYLPHPCASLCDSLGHIKPVKQVSHKNGVSMHVFTRNDSLISECLEDSLRLVIERHNVDTEVMQRAYEEQIRQIVSDRPTAWYDLAGRWALGLDVLAILIVIVLGIVHFTKHA